MAVIARPSNSTAVDRETLQLLHSTDWTQTALGAMERWPTSLRVAVGICLQSRFPMFVWWGPELISIYNDAYIPMLGDRHPEAFGAPARETWREIWPVIGPQADAVMQRGEATWNERVLLVMERKGYTEDTYFNWAYSPIVDENGHIAGLFCVCSEETASVRAEHERDELLQRVENERAGLAAAFEQSPAFVAVLKGPDHIFEFANERYFQLIGRRDVIGKPARRAVPEIVEQGIVEALDEVYATGKRYIGTAMRLMVQKETDEPLEEIYVDFVFQPLRDVSGAVTGILVHGVELTEHRRAEARDRFLVNLEDAVRQLADPAEITSACARLLAEYLLVDRCAYADVESDEDTFNLAGDFNRGVPSIVGKYRFAQFGGDVLQLMREDQPFVSRDVESHQPPLGDLSAYRQMGIRAVICVPLHKGGRLVGAMAVHDSMPRAWTAGEIELVQHVASRCWESIERARVEAALRESETRFRHMSDNAPVMIWVTRPDGYCEYLNKQWYVFTGQSEKEALGFGWADAVHETDRARAVEEFMSASARRESFKLDFQLRRRDGSYRYCVDAGTPRMSASGDFLGYIGTVLDITERKVIEDALASEKRVLELIATGSPVPAVLERIVRRVESQSTDGMLCAILLLDDTGEQLLHGAAPSLPPAYNQSVIKLRMGSVVRSLVGLVTDRRVLTPTEIGQDPRWAEFVSLADAHGLTACCSMPIISSQGLMLGAVGMHYRHTRRPSEHDIELVRSASHLAGIVIEKSQVDRRLRESLESEQEARSEAERASFMKDEFLATLSHELRTPLNAILGWLAILKLKGVPPDAAQGIEVIERNARAQAQIIEDLLDMSGIISGKVRLELQRMDLVSSVQLAVETARPTADAKDIQLETSIDASHDLLINGDPHRVQQVLWNLTSNAIKFTPRGGRVSVALRSDENQVEVSVTDSGEGIEPNFLPFVFDRFRQADASIRRRHGGLGLGLSISKMLVELHGGSIQATSEGPGRGATFTVSLPINHSHAFAHPMIERRQRRSSGAAMEESEAVSDVSGVRVLVVDDDADAREVARRLLEDSHAIVTTAGSAHEAMELVQQQKFDVLVSDIGMPEEDGHVLIRRLRALGPSRGGDIPAIALTAYARPDDCIKALRAGFQVHIAKPIEANKLIGTVASLASRKEPLQDAEQEQQH